MSITMADIATKSQVLPPLAEWYFDPEVGSLVYYLPKDYKQLQEVNLWLGNEPLMSVGGFFRVGFEKTLPQVVMASYSLTNCSSCEGK